MEAQHQEILSLLQTMKAMPERGIDHELIQIEEDGLIDQDLFNGHFPVKNMTEYLSVQKKIEEEVEFKKCLVSPLKVFDNLFTFICKIKDKKR